MWVKATRLLTSLLLLLPLSAYCAGLGKLTVLSNLGQPFSAEIELVAVKADDIDSIVARVASPDRYREANLEYVAAVLKNLKFKVLQKPGGNPYVKITSTATVNEAYLGLLIELSWPSGRLLREYTVLLDPVETVKAPEAAPVAETAPAVSPPTVTAPPQAPAAPAPEAAAPAPAPAPPEILAPAPEATTAPTPEAAPTPTAAPNETTYEVKRGDYLRKIADEYKPEGATLEQMLVALYRANRDAFIGNNMNRLKAGKILNLPPTDDVSAIGQGQALKEIRVQTADWNAYKQQLAGAVTQPSRETPQKEAGGKITAKVEEKAAAAEPTKDVLKLSKAADTKGTPQDKINAMREEAVAKEKAIQEANSRVADLEKQVSDMKKILELKSKTLSDLQKQAGGAAPAAPAPAPAPAPARTPEAAPTPKTAETQPQAPKPAAETKPAETKPATEAKPAETKTATQPAAPKPVPAGPPPEKSFIEEMVETVTDDPLLYGGIGGGVLVLLGGAAFVLKKKAASPALKKGKEPEFRQGPQDFDQTPVLPQGAVAAEGQQAPASEEVDPITEAEVYLAYNRFAQAEEILKDALKKTPNRPEVLEKLLEVYSARKDPASFEKFAKQLIGVTGANHPLWEKAAVMGRSLDPKNTFYGGTGEEPAETAVGGPMPPPEVEFDVTLPAAGAAAGGGSQLDFDIGGAAAAATAAPDIALDIPAAPEADLGMDFKLDSGLVPTPSKGKQAEEPAPMAFDGGISFDLGAPVEASAAAPAAAAPKSEDLGLNMDFLMDTGAPEAPPASAAEEGLPGLSLDLGAGGAATVSDEKVQEVATKLDLARAYQEMGDSAGAGEILREVLSEGNAQQQEEAKTMLAKLA